MEKKALLEERAQQSKKFESLEERYGVASKVKKEKEDLLVERDAREKKLVAELENLKSRVETPNSLLDFFRILLYFSLYLCTLTHTHTVSLHQTLSYFFLVGC